MIYTPCQSSCIPSFGTAFVLVWALSLIPGIAEAACGDYLVIGHREHHVPTFPIDNTGRKAPCGGLDCSSQPTIPFVPGPAPANPHPDTKALAPCSLESTANVSRGVPWPSRSDEHAVRRTRSIFRPPRY
jgi:hypothetical protein